ncbi:hypothetical protein [Mycoplasmopsis edwardii]|uniref:Uncharacterized protein n=1 Tax=Mycoplasmopsis edwardii TaxID=53558 RepID=A0ACD4PH25_9BACT|nr:hypothetical protein [Mycoplasmopsis edwardii]WBP83893.1 hypothetical protein Me_995_000519 [Mycoplasmopsis edwardii]
MKLKNIFLLASSLVVLPVVSCQTQEPAKTTTAETSKETNNATESNTASSNDTNVVTKTPQNNENNSDKNQEQADYANAFELIATENIGQIFNDLLEVHKKRTKSNELSYMQIYGVRTNPADDVRSRIYLAPSGSYNKNKSISELAVLKVRESLNHRAIEKTGESKNTFIASFDEQTRVLTIQYKANNQSYTQTITIPNA